MESTYSITVKGEDAKKAKDLNLDPSHKLSVGDSVMLEGKRYKATSVTLNATTSKFDVEVEPVPEGNARPTAEGNDPHPERHAVKDVTLDPNFTPAVADVHRPASENAAILAGDVQTGSSEGPVDQKTGKHRALGADAPAEQQQERLAAEKQGNAGQRGNQPRAGQQGGQRGERQAQRDGSISSPGEQKQGERDTSRTDSRTEHSREGSKQASDTSSIRR